MTRAPYCVGRRVVCVYGRCGFWCCSLVFRVISVGRVSLSSSLLPLFIAIPLRSLLYHRELLFSKRSLITAILCMVRSVWLICVSPKNDCFDGWVYRYNNNEMFSKINNTIKQYYVSIQLNTLAVHQQIICSIISIRLISNLEHEVVKKTKDRLTVAAYFSLKIHRVSVIEILNQSACSMNWSTIFYNI